jgi:hypothetical protein
MSRSLTTSHKVVSSFASLSDHSLHSVSLLSFFLSCLFTLPFRIAFDDGLQQQTTHGSRLGFVFCLVLSPVARLSTRSHTYTDRDIGSGGVDDCSSSSKMIPLVFFFLYSFRRHCERARDRHLCFSLHFLFLLMLFVFMSLYNGWIVVPQDHGNMGLQGFQTVLNLSRQRLRRMLCTGFGLVGCMSHAKTHQMRVHSWRLLCTWVCSGYPFPDFYLASSIVSICAIALLSCFLFIRPGRKATVHYATMSSQSQSY